MSSPRTYDEHQIVNPIQQLHHLAAEASGVSIEAAYAIDEINLGKKLPDYVFTQLADIFYRKIYDDTDPANDWFRLYFQHKTIEESVLDLSEYLTQRLGGKNYYTQRKGFINLHAHHCMLKLPEKAAERWMEYMKETLDEMESDINDATADKLKDFFRFTAFLMVIGGQKAAEMKCKRSYDPFPDPIIPIPGDAEEGVECRPMTSSSSRPITGSSSRPITSSSRPIGSSNTHN
jgi:truncated hemoglobin YjbI